MSYVSDKDPDQLSYRCSLIRAFLACLQNQWICYVLFLSSVDFFLKINFFKKSFRNTIRESNGLDPDQARHFV